MVECWSCPTSHNSLVGLWFVHKPVYISGQTTQLNDLKLDWCILWGTLRHEQIWSCFTEFLPFPGFWLVKKVSAYFSTCSTEFQLFSGLCSLLHPISSLQWRHNGRDSVSKHQPRECLLSRLIRQNQRKCQSSASLAFVRGIHRRPVNSPHKGPVTRKMFPFDDVIM